MKFAKKTTLLFLFAAAMSFGTFAQDAQARFSLSHPTRLGNSVLPPGDYEMTVSFNGLAKAFITPVSAKGPAVIAVPVVVDSYATCTGTTVGMLHAGSSWSIESVCMAEPRLALHFRLPAVNTEIASADADTSSANVGR